MTVAIRKDAMILTSDPDDIRRLIRASGGDVALVVIRGASAGFAASAAEDHPAQLIARQGLVNPIVHFGALRYRECLWVLAKIS